MATASAIDLEPLRTALPSRVIGPGEPGYDDARMVWNAAIDRRPAAIARCEGSADVVAALRFARERGLRVSVRGGGHNVAGLAVCDGGLVIDLSRMKGARVDPRARIARVEPGATWGDLDRATQAFGLAVPGGLVSSTGVAGFTLGGGLGWLTRRFGPACDSLVSAEVVTADGDVGTVSEEERPELLWGLRGGGGNFGVVTRFDLRLHPVGPTVLAGPRAYPLERLREVLAFHRALIADAPDDLATLVVLRQAPPAAWIPPAVHGRRVVMLVLCWAGEHERGRRVLAGLDELGPPLADALGPMPYLAFQSFFDAAWQPGFQNYWKAEYLSGLDEAAIESLERFTGSITSPLSDIKPMHLGRDAGDASAFTHGDARLVLNINARWTDPREAEAHVNWTRELWEAMRPCSSGGVYVNFLGDEGNDRVRAAYGPATYARLVALKDRYDPDNVFRVNQNIAPSGDRAAERRALG